MKSMYRRDFLFGAAALMANGPKVEAVAAGDPIPGRAVIWARADRPSQMTVKWKAGSKTGAVRGQAASAASDFTARTDIGGLPAGELVQYSVHFEEGKIAGAPMEGSFRAVPGAGRDVSFLWSGDMVGQGWGVQPDRGIKLFDSMRRRETGFFIHSGDTIYADGPIESEVKLPDGAVWKNVVTEAKSKVAESLDEFRGCHRYNLLDENLRRFTASTAQVWQWDDHEVMNNWSPGKDLTADNRYKEKDIRKIVARARQAFLEYAPIRFADLSSAYIHRRIPYGPLLDVFVLDMRSFRAANNYNLQKDRSGETDYLGSPQLEWLKRDLKRSKAVWYSGLNCPASFASSRIGFVGSCRVIIIPQAAPSRSMVPRSSPISLRPMLPDLTEIMTGSMSSLVFRV